MRKTASATNASRTSGPEEPPGVIGSSRKAVTAFGTGAVAAPSY
jgi:hypothetical protein